MVYDLGDASKWEFFFPNVEKPLLVIPGEDIPEQVLQEMCICIIVNKREILIIGVQ